MHVSPLFTARQNTNNKSTEEVLQRLPDNNDHRLTAFVPRQPGQAGTRRNTLPSALAEGCAAFRLRFPTSCLLDFYGAGEDNGGRGTDSPQLDSHNPPKVFTAGCPSCHPTNRVKALKAYGKHQKKRIIKTIHTCQRTQRGHDSLLRKVAEGRGTPTYTNNSINNDK